MQKPNCPGASLPVALGGFRRMDLFDTLGSKEGPGDLRSACSPGGRPAFPDRYGVAISGAPVMGGGPAMQGQGAKVRHGQDLCPRLSPPSGPLTCV